MLHDTLAREERKTILLSTHNLYEAQDMCDRIAILDRGKITACDTPDNIRHAIFEEKVFEMSFTDAIYYDEGGRLVDELEKMAGVHGVTPEIDPDGSFRGISIRVHKNMDINEVLEAAMKRGLKMRSVNTNEPTLEEAFIAITRQHKGGEAIGNWKSP